MAMQPELPASVLRAELLAGLADRIYEKRKAAL